MKRRHFGNICISLVTALSLSGCVTEDFPECPNEYMLRIVYDRNMLFADAFASQVKSVDIKVFDSETGHMVFHHSEEGTPLSVDGYRASLPVPPGTYDILCWGGMAEGISFGYADPAADILQNNNVLLRMENGLSKDRLDNLYHGLLQHVTFVDNNDIGSIEPQTAAIYLTKNTNRINVILHNLDGTEMDESDFTFTVSSVNAGMGYDNSLDPQGKVKYYPWHISSIGSVDASGVLVPSVISAEFSTGRLTTAFSSRLDIIRNSDGERIISIPLERNLLLYKGEFHSSMTDQEYLDRQDDYTLTFILDKNNNWDKAAMIYINDWATPPVQYQEW